MSYSFNVRAAGKAAALAAISAQFDTIVQGQQMHAVDRADAERAAASFLDLVGEPPEGQELVVYMSGSVSWRGTDNGNVVTGAGANVSVALAPKI